MNYSHYQRKLTRDLSRCVKLGLPAWAAVHVAERMEYASYWRQLALDRSQPSEARSDRYVKAVQVQLGLIELLDAYRLSTALT